MNLILLMQLLVVGLCQSVQGFHLHDLRVDCRKDGISVTVEFQEPFQGIIYSKGYHETRQCQYVTLSNNRAKSFNFLIPKRDCGTNVQTQRGNQEIVMENVIIIQNDPDITEAWDVARRLRCIWRQSFAKIVTSRPFQVERPVMVPINFTEDAVNAFVQVQSGRGPFSSPASGYLQVGDESSLVVFIQDPTNRYDARMLDCEASDGRRSAVRLTDDKGCVTRPELMTPFYKTRNTRHTGANLIMYTHFRAFRVADTPKFHISCNMQVCNGECADVEPCRNKSQEASIYKRRSKRLTSNDDQGNLNDSSGRGNRKIGDLRRCDSVGDEVDAIWILATVIFGAISVFLIGLLLIMTRKLREMQNGMTQPGNKFIVYN